MRNFILKRVFLLSVLFLLVFISSCSENKNIEKTPVPGDLPNTLTAEEKAAGWQLLFDGETFNGWRGLGREGIPDGHWKIEKGTIRKIESGLVPVQADGQPLKGGDLMTIKTYRNYDFKFEWKISEGGNSGIKYNVSEEMSTAGGPSHAALGFEYQVLDDARHPDNQNITHLAAALYDMIPAKNSILKPVGQFNSGRILFMEDHGEHWLNGVKVLEFDLKSTRFDSLFQKSKYHKRPDFPKKRDAHIVLQDHSDDVWYRNLKIRVLE